MFFFALLDEKFAPELYVVTETATHALFVNSGVNFSYGVKSFFTLDKRNRLVFYLNTTNSVIYKGSINSPFYSKVFKKNITLFNVFMTDILFPAILCT